MEDPKSFIGKSFQHLDSTPAFIVHLQKLIDNCAKMKESVKLAGVSIRPHIKTHKTIEGAILQLFPNNEKDQISKIVVSTLGEAEFFAQSGKFEDILYAVPISPTKLPKVVQISKKVKRFCILIDTIDHVDSLIEYSKKNPEIDKWNVFMKINAGYGRAGVNPNDDISIKIAKYINESKNMINFIGLYSHSGDSYNSKDADQSNQVAERERDCIVKFADKIRSIGIHFDTVSIGSTPACSNAKSFDGISEIHPGNYVFYDRFQATIGSCKKEDVACCVLSTVISHYPDRNRMLIDAGALALSKDIGATDGKDWGDIKDNSNLKIVSISQEVGIVESRDGSPIQFNKYPIGSKLMIIPNHSCLTASMFPYLFVEKEGVIVNIWETCPRYW